MWTFSGISWHDHVTNEVMAKSEQLAEEDDLLVTFCDFRQPDQLVWLWNGSQKAAGGGLEDQ